ncbi:hypothetical protein KUTeg_018400 [Tegillarca granosa]|uniref:Uncharacterized protein n=1 Tax=Tegillarca granosa TaxID=220873 RepID=A0ABQ9ELN5_TEGGR|nr:hypothetical protein KUTeg_018400 [Tegillarca granosa]
MAPFLLQTLLPDTLCILLLQQDIFCEETFWYDTTSVAFLTWRQSLINEEERRIALEKKRLAINNAKRQWELMQGSMMGQTGKLVKMPELYANHVGTVPNSEISMFKLMCWKK